MESTLTIRLSSGQRDAVRKRAAALNQTESEFVRSLIARDLDESSILDRIASLVGSVDSSRSGMPHHPLEREIRGRNWRR